MKRFIKLDKLFRDTKGMTYKEILDELADDDMYIEKRTLLKDIENFEELGAVFTKSGRGNATLIRYSDHSYSVFDTINTDMEALKIVIDKLRIIDDQRFAMVRISLEQFRNGLSERDIPIMSFQSNPYSAGLDHIEPLADAILNRYPVRIEYAPFNKGPLLVCVHPYHLRQYNNRWVLVGWNEEKSQIHTYPLDRIKTVKHLSKAFHPTDINFDEFFGDVIGTTNDLTRPVEEIVLRVDKRTYNYILTKPIHESQTELKETETEKTIDIRLSVKINKELEMQILSYGDGVEVLQPQKLRRRIASIVNNLNSRYQV